MCMLGFSFVLSENDETELYSAMDPCGLEYAIKFRHTT